MLFGAFSFFSFLAALAEDGRLPIRAFRALHHGAFGKVFVALGAAFAFFLASYTGVLLSVTNRPIWADTNLLGLLFLLSGASTAAALMILLARRRRGVPGPALRSLYRFDGWVMLLELLVLVAVVISLGAVATAWLNAWGLLLLVGRGARRHPGAAPAAPSAPPGEPQHPRRIRPGADRRLHPAGGRGPVVRGDPSRRVGSWAGPRYGAMT